VSDLARVQTEDEQIVAILHDVVEDTPWTFEKLATEGFPPHILGALACVTKQDGEAYEAFVERSASNPIARQVKLADLEDNMDVRRLGGVTEKDRDCLNRYSPPTGVCVRYRPFALLGNLFGGRRSACQCSRKP
jgi:hypothetical protein